VRPQARQCVGRCTGPCAGSALPWAAGAAVSLRVLSPATPDTPAAPEVEVTDLARVYGRRRALDGVSFTLRAGETLALFGPNGAGKTTLLRLLAGLLKPTGGTARIEGDLLPGTPATRARVGLISHHSLLYPALTALENVAFTARLYGVPDPDAAARRALERLGVADRARTPVRLLSRGLLQRVSVARALVHGPRVVLADEPYTGLDAAGAGALTRVLRELLGQGTALVLVTHQLDEGLALASQAAILLQGRFVRHDVGGVSDPAAFTAAYRALVTADAA
jgi:heme exporter protein A